MSTITSLTVQKKNKERVNVYLDGEFAFGLSLNLALPLRRGQELTASEIDELKNEDQYEKAKSSALRFLAQRPRSQAEVSRNLRKKAYEAEVADRVIQRLVELEILDDVAFANYWVEQRETFKPRSRLALGQELFQKGVSREIVDQAVEQVDEAGAARRAAEQKSWRWRDLPEPELQKQLTGYLSRRGFHYAIIREIFDEMRDARQSGEDWQE